MLIAMYEKLGSKWVKIAEYFPGRSDNSIKNRWNSTLKRKLEYQRNGGHRPRRGRPPQHLARQKRLEVPQKPHSADDIPRPPRFDDIAGEMREVSPFGRSATTPRLLSSFSGIKSPLPLMSPGVVKDLSGWSPTKEFRRMEFSPGLLFSPSHASLKEDGEEFLNCFSPMLSKSFS
jgi:hypothetical protein